MTDHHPTVTIETDDYTPSQQHRAMWLQVVFQAFKDASEHKRLLDYKAGWKRKYRAEAKEWLLSQTDDFRESCEHAGLDPDVVFQTALARAENGWPEIEKI